MGYKTIGPCRPCPRRLRRCDLHRSRRVCTVATAATTSIAKQEPGPAPYPDEARYGRRCRIRIGDGPSLPPDHFFREIRHILRRRTAEHSGDLIHEVLREQEDGSDGNAEIITHARQEYAFVSDARQRTDFEIRDSKNLHSAVFGQFRERHNVAM